MPFQPGQSGNPAGRPRGAAGLAAYIRSISRDGEEIADKLLEIVKTGSNRDATAAAQTLYLRMLGQPAHEVSLQLTRAADVLPPGFDQLGHEEKLAVLDQIRARALTAGDA